MRVLGSRMLNLWCRLMHHDPMWPVNGHYRCSVCLRSHPVLWEERPVTKAPVVVMPVRQNEAPVRAASPAPRIAIAASR
jgi:hypothetical protein